LTFIAIASASQRRYLITGFLIAVYSRISIFKLEVTANIKTFYGQKPILYHKFFLKQVFLKYLWFN